MAAGSPEERLAELGLAVPDVVPPVAAYVPAVRSGAHVFTAGQIPMREGTLVATGKVGDTATPEQATEAAQQCALNALAAIRSVTGTLEGVRIVKVVVFVASSPDFTGQPAVANGASELLGQVFGDLGVHARSAVGVAALPLDATVEVEVVAEVLG
ncbi:MAG TPA: RidA family protein [Nocardioides sp.]|nr:RidA family protein [Nocardioides sp.]